MKEAPKDKSSLDSESCSVRKPLHTRRLAMHRKQATENLKRCPLCGAINASVNDECFKCSWYGNFDTDPTRIEAGLNELLTQCPELADAMADTSILKLTLIDRLRHSVTDCRDRVEIFIDRINLSRTRSKGRKLDETYDVESLLPAFFSDHGFREIGIDERETSRRESIWSKLWRPMGGVSRAISASLGRKAFPRA